MHAQNNTVIIFFVFICITIKSFEYYFSFNFLINSLKAGKKPSNKGLSRCSNSTSLNSFSPSTN